jgi:2'-5' RNA ligase
VKPPALHFLALEPDDAFAGRVVAWKRRVRQAVGDQVYLDHPPHLTLYSACFPAGAELRPAAAAVAGRVTAPAVRIDGWHVFQHDRMTGAHTLVCNVSADGRPGLLAIQEPAVAALAPLRDVPASRARYDAAWDRLSDAERGSVEACGFAHVGDAWRPHVTVASIRPEDWPAAWLALAGDSPQADVHFPALALYAVEGGRPVLIERFLLREPRP